MPRSKNHATIEIPVDLHEQLRKEAARRGVTVFVLASQLLRQGLAGTPPASPAVEPRSWPASFIYPSGLHE